MKTNKRLAYGLFLTFSIGVLIDEARDVVHKKWETALLWLVYFILRHRNVSRSAFTSRRDNNELWGLSERVERIIRRINSNYENV